MGRIMKPETIVAEAFGPGPSPFTPKVKKVDRIDLRTAYELSVGAVQKGDVTEPIYGLAVATYEGPGNVIPRADLCGLYANEQDALARVKEWKQNGVPEVPAKRRKSA